MKLDKSQSYSKSHFAQSINPSRRSGRNSSTIRITSGTLRGQKLITPKNAATHPMGSREKLALFNTLNAIRGPLTPETTVLDLYCGSGALGFEALSRGAGKVVFVDNSPDALEAVKANALSTKMEKNVELHRSSALEPNWLVAPDSSSTSAPSSTNHSSTSDTNLSAVFESKLPATFDLVFADPPYDHFPSDLSPLQRYLKPGAILVLSHPKSADLSSLKNLKHISSKSYAAANLSFFQYRNR